jgi:hypothetical protein
MDFRPLCAPQTREKLDAATIIYAKRSYKNPRTGVPNNPTGAVSAKVLPMLDLRTPTSDRVDGAESSCAEAVRVRVNDARGFVACSMRPGEDRNRLRYQSENRRQELQGGIHLQGKADMISFRSFLGLSVLMATFATWPVLGQSAAEPPSRIGNIWDGRAHEPNPSAVESDLKAKGFALTPQRNQVVTDEVEDLYQRLIGTEDKRGLETASRGNRPLATPRPGRSAPQ